MLINEIKRIFDKCYVWLRLLKRYIQSGKVIFWLERLYHNGTRCVWYMKNEHEMVLVLEPESIVRAQHVSNPKDKLCPYLS